MTDGHVKVQLYISIVKHQLRTPHCAVVHRLIPRIIVNMTYSEQQARELRSEFNAFDNAIRAALAGGTITKMMTERGKEMVCV